MIDSGVLHEIVPFRQEPRNNIWTNEQRYVPEYRPYYGRRTAFGFDVDDIFDIGITFTHGQPIMRVFTDLIIMSEDHKQEDIPTPINLSLIMEEEETKEEQIFNVDTDDVINLDETDNVLWKIRRMASAASLTCIATYTADGKDPYIDFPAVRAYQSWTLLQIWMWLELF